MLARRWQVYLAVASATTMLLIGLKGFVLSWLISHSLPPAWWTSYTRAVISVNYFDVGFVRRGLGGTIAILLSRDSVAGGLLFSILSTVLLVIPIGLLLARLGRVLKPSALLYMAVIVALSPQTFLGWSKDLVRTDVLVEACIAWGVLATLSGRRGLGMASLLLGLLVHETAVIFGWPLLLALNTQAYLAGRLDKRKAIVIAVGFFIGLIAIYLAQSMFSPPGPVIAAHMQQRFPSNESPFGMEMRDTAIYMMVSGTRGLKTAICYNLQAYPQYYPMFAACLLMLAAYVFALSLGTRLLSAAIAVFAPVVFMLLIANDTGRWVKLGVFNAWLLAAAFQIDDPWAKRPRPAVMAAGVLMLAVFIAMGSSPVHEVNRFARQVSLHFGFGDPGGPAAWLQQCDPQWRSFLARP
jgi:hypothetical protein